MNLWNLFKGAQHSCEGAQQMCVKKPASPFPAFSWTDVCQSAQNEPLLPFCFVSFIFTLWFSLESKHRHCPFSQIYFAPSAHCIFYIGSLSETCAFSIRTDWNEWMFMYRITYCCASLLYPSMVGTRRSRLKLNTVWRPQQKYWFQNNNNNNNTCFYSETCSINFRLYCIVQTTLLYIEGQTFCETLYNLQYITTVEVSVVLWF